MVHLQIKVQFPDKQWVGGRGFDDYRTISFVIITSTISYFALMLFTAKLICVLVFANANCWFDHEAAHLPYMITPTISYFAFKKKHFSIKLDKLKMITF